MRHRIVIASLALVVAMAPVALAELHIDVVWPPNYHDISLVCTPGGTGDPLSNATRDGGSRIDATIRAKVWWRPDSGGNWIVLDPSQLPLDDVWLDFQHGSPVEPWVGCAHLSNGYHVAGTADCYDYSTLQYVFEGPLMIGGHIEPEDSELHVMVQYFAGGNFDSSIDFPGNFGINSPDISGDGAVGLADLVIFTPIYHDVEPYSYSCDFDFDGEIGLTDLNWLSNTYFGDHHDCP